MGADRFHRVARPRPARAADLKHALTFFLTGRQRRAILRALAAVDRDRARALLLVVRGLRQPARPLGRSQRRTRARLAPEGRAELV